MRIGRKLVGLLSLTTIGAVYAGQTFTPRTDETLCYWDDWECWDARPSSDAKINSKVPELTMAFTNGVSGYTWGFFVGSKSGPITLRIDDGGSASFSSLGGGLHLGHPAGTTAYADVRQGGTLGGGLAVGSLGCGVVTNRGTIKPDDSYVGYNAGSKGLWVHDGGVNSFPNPKNLYVGYNGTGTVDVVSGQFYWHWWTGGIGYVRVGESPNGQGHGSIVVEAGANFLSRPIFLGGRGSNAGYGELVLRGGTFYNLYDNGADSPRVKGEDHRPDNMFIGTATNATGAIAENSRGVIRGWGEFRANGNNSSMRDQRSISAVLGNGAIIGDGEGQERTLDLAYFWRVTNGLFTAAANTNGWYAINKGAVNLPGVDCSIDTNGGDGWGCFSGDNSVGCSRFLKKPDLVNAVHITSSRNYEQHGYCYGVQVLALDRSDVHAEALKPTYRPIGFWKAGPFSDREYFTTANRNNSFVKAKIDFRYDHTKVASSDSKIVVLRWNQNTESWTTLAKVAQPDDYIVSSGEFSGLTSDDTFLYGLFCVAEAPPVGMAIIFR